MKLLTTLVALLLAPLALAQTTQPTTRPSAPPFIIGVWQQPASSAAKWRALGVNTIYGHDTEGGRVTKAQWEEQVAAAGEYFIDAPGADVAAEATKSNGIRSDMSVHVYFDPTCRPSGSCSASRARPGCRRRSRRRTAAARSARSSPSRAANPRGTRPSPT